ncbi:hypothetical protein FIBSPDRAFT_879490, partial [Athelia psychrophila]
MWPYSTNPIRTTHGRVRNWSDGPNIFNDSHGPEGHYDPVFWRRSSTRGWWASSRWGSTRVLRTIWR